MAFPAAGPITELMVNNAVLGASSVYETNTRSKRTFQGIVKGTGAVSASVTIEVSNNGVDFLTLATISLTGTNSASDGFVSDAPWQFVRANLTAVSGTGASVGVIMGA